MCRLFAAAASAPVDVSFELLRSDNSVLRQSEEHDSGWGSVYYTEHGEEVNRFPQAAHADESFDELTSGRARLIMVHVRRATIGGLTLENTHPFTRGPYSYCHNGTILKASELEPLADRAPVGDTDSERFFNLLMADFDSGDVIASLRRAVERTCDTCRFSALNFLFCDGKRLYAYRFGVYKLFWRLRVDEPRRRHGDALSPPPRAPARRARRAGRQRGAHRERALERVRPGRAAGLRPRRPRPSRGSSGCWARARTPSSSSRWTRASCPAPRAANGPRSGRPPAFDGHGGTPARPAPGRPARCASRLPHHHPRAMELAPVASSRDAVLRPGRRGMGSALRERSRAAEAAERRARPPACAAAAGARRRDRHGRRRDAGCRPLARCAGDGNRRRPGDDRRCTGEDGRPAHPVPGRGRRDPRRRSGVRPRHPAEHAAVLRTCRDPAATGRSRGR